MTSLLQDIRVAIRSFRRAPGFATLVVMTLAVGIGGTVAMFSVTDAVLFADLPYRDSDRMTVIWNRHATTGADKVQISGPDFVDYRDQSSSFEGFTFVHNATNNTLTDGGRAEQVDVGFVSANFFQFLGVDAVIGRTFSADEDASSAAAVGASVVISHGLWARRYGSDPGVLGRTVFLSGQPVQILGVTPPNFRLILPFTEGGAMSSGANDNADIWRILPDRGFPTMPRSIAVVRVLGRLAPEVTVEQAQEEFDLIAAGLRRDHRIHQERGTQIDIVGLQTEVVDHVRSIILSLFGAVAVVLLISCANVANLVSVQTNNRSREVAVRVALGAHRGRILRQLFTEYIVLAGVGAVLGIALAAILVRTIVNIAPTNVPLIDGIGIDLRALFFAMLVTSIATLLFGILPAMRVAGTPPSSQLSAGVRSSFGRGNRFRRALVVVEIALSLVLLVGGGLLIRSFVRLQGATLGFEPASVLTAKVALGHGAYDDESLRREYWDALRVELDRHPAVRRAGLVWPLPFAGQGVDVAYNSIGGESDDWGRFVAFPAVASPGYFATMRADIINGRAFEEQDLSRSDEIVIVDDLVATRLYPDGSAVGKTVWVEERGGTRRPFEIVGVVRHIRHSSVTGSERDVIYRPAVAARNLAVVLRTVGGPASMISELRRITGALDKDVPLFDERTLASYLGDQVAPTKFTMTLAATFGIVALLMAVVGLYGVISYAVAQRTGELGVRMALGAEQGSIVRLIMRDGVVMVGMGIVVGVVVALGVTRGIRSLLVEIPSNDPLTFIATAVLLATVALVASYLPARRAARLDPAFTLRDD